MADTRINALSTATSSVSDDFVPIDGTTNGTRKLSAYSPSFGGNATVGGTLTVNGAGTNTLTGTTVLSGSGTVQGSLSQSSTGQVGLELIRSGGTAASWVVYVPTGSTDLRFFASSDRMTLTGAGNLSLSSTTASTTTSSGALVVGNGTQGGLGVGGSIYAGANINSAAADAKIQILGTGNTTGVKEINLLRSDGGDACTIGLTGTAYAGVFAAGGLGNNEAFIYNASPFRVFVGTASTNRFDFTSSQFKINATTASNNTSSGALVVSGGVGVAGNTNIGGALRFHTNTALPGTASISKDATFGLNFYASTGSSYDFTIFNAAGTGLLVNPTGTSALTAFDTFTATGTLIANAASNAFRITTAQTPASAGATGTAGTICWDTSYIYVCTATNTWKRVAISTW